MVKRYIPQRKALDALIQVYAPPKRVRIFSLDSECPTDLPCIKAADELTAAKLDKIGWTLSGALRPVPVSVPLDDITFSNLQVSETKTTANACNSRPLDTSEQDSTVSPDRKRKRTESKRQSKRRWSGCVAEALSDVFTALWINYVEPTDEFQVAHQLKPGAGNPGTDAKLVSKVFSSEKLMAARDSFRIHFQLMQAFSSVSALQDWDCHPAVDAYVSFLKADPMIRECCLGLFSRLGAEQFGDVDQFIDTLRQVWFQPVQSGFKIPRCGYHHVCIGDFSPKGKTLSGMHSWFKFLIEEERQYTRILKWYLYQTDLHLVSLSFNMRHPNLDAWFTKPKSSFLVGVPSDFELLLFTVITMVNPNKDTTVQIKDYEPLVVVPRSVKTSGSVITAFFRESPTQSPAS